jgi:predicted dehydrogenase
MKLFNFYIRKIIRFIHIYGFLRVYAKVAGRTRLHFLKALNNKYTKKDVAVIGCGQFAFSTLAFFINKRFGNRIFGCYDPNENSVLTFARFYKIGIIADDFEELLQSDFVKYIYIASNHATHTEYAVRALAQSKIVYVEKPVSVSYLQFKRLLAQVKKTNATIYAGYNRPFSRAIQKLRKRFNNGLKPVTIACFITGHLIKDDNWYRDPAEGTRICGNVGHWIDLAVHILSWNTLADKWKIVIAYSDIKTPDDNITISLTSSNKDLVTITLSSRCEPFEGIDETINIQYGDLIAKIDDFRQMIVWEKDKKQTFKYCPKDVGHQRAVMQPFSKDKREWHEIELSTLLMLFIKDMILDRSRYASFSFVEQFKKIQI